MIFSSRLPCDGAKITALRVQRLMTRDKLGHKTKLGVDIIKYAEMDGSVSPRILAAIDGALKVSAGDITRPKTRPAI